VLSELNDSVFEKEEGWESDLKEGKPSKEESNPLLFEEEDEVV
jgi:hypothetical protein